jgi:YD repeat-containing protein
MKKHFYSAAGSFLLIWLLIATGYANEVSYTYDQLNRLVGVVNSDGTIITYEYDDVGNRVIQNVIQTPEANFTARPTSGIAPLSVAFRDKSVGIVSSWSWSFGDGGSSTSQSPAYTYSSAGTYTVILTVSNSFGSSSYQATITVNPPPPPVANFIASPATGAAPLSVQFTDASTGSVTSWSWNFGDGGTSTSQNPSHTYANPGTYTVTLTAGGPGGNSNPQTTSITVIPPPPVANFSATPSNGTVPLSVQFTDASTGSVTSWSWTFGDDGTSTSQNPSHTYTNPGTYTVTLTAGGPGGNSNPQTTSITVIPPPPAANFSATPSNGTVPLSVQFTDASTGSVTSWSWVFGDGGTSASQNPSYTYSTPGTYTVSLTVTGPGGASTKSLPNCITVNFQSSGLDQYTKMMLHGNGPNNGNQITDATGNHTPTSVNSVTTSTGQSKFGGSSISFNNSRVTYPDSSDWYFSGGQDFTVDFWLYTANLPTYGVGIFGGLNAGTGLAVRSSELGTAGQIGLVTNGVNWELLTKQLLPLNTWNHIALVRYNGVTRIYLNGVADSVTYSGPYTDSHNGFSIGDVYDPSVHVNYFASTAFLQEFRLSQGIARWTSNFTPPQTPYTVETAPPTANFSAYPANGAAPLPVQFTDRTTGLATSWSWAFGDGSTSTSEDPSHTYSTAGTYMVSLTATSTEGSSTYTSYITVNAPVPGIDQYTKLLLHGYGVNNGNVITDATGNHTPTSVNSVTTSTGQSKFGGSSISFNNSRVTYPDSSDWYFSGGQDFTVDFWLYTANLPNYGVGIFGGLNAGTGLAVRSSELGTAGQIGLVTNGVNWVLLTRQLLPLNTWNHIALVRYNGVTTIYLNGVADPVTYTGPYTDSHNGLSIGDVYDPSISVNYFASTAFLQEFRLSRGIARWTSNFTPPTSAYGN